MASTERQRFVHGLGWGAVATVVMGAATLLAMALHLWPLARPLSVLGAQAALGSGRALPWLFLTAALVQLVYGALCGGLLSLLSEPVTMASALGLGLLRWFGTQVLVLPALGWTEFGLALTPSIALVTLIPHLAYAVSLGWLMGREDEHPAGFLPPSWQHRLAHIPRPSRPRR
jgi:hypothetical protein